MRHLCILLFFWVTLPVNATLKVAVASNFKVTFDEIVSLYQQQSGHKILVSSGSTGTLYHQIKNGAPFDLFLSADSKRAQLIEASPLGIKGSRFTYAQGELAFWQPNSDKSINENSLLALSERIAIANPKLAPYGLASKQALQTLKMWSKLTYIQGNNIVQTYQFIDTGNIEAGFVAYSLLLQNNAKNYYLLPIESYQPILQQAVMLAKSKNKVTLQKFVDFLQSQAIVKLIRSKGYL
ncbi:MAG: molybdate ABC transporter substrate-binding protein [Psychromonas sp.]